MVMTHYMELLAVSPMHLILLMVLPMGLAELLVAAEIFALIQGKESKWHIAKRAIGGILTIYYTAMVVYVLKDVLPTIQEWRGWADKWAIYSLILAVIPLWALALSCFFTKKLGEKAKNITHAVLLVIYLVVAHLAMIFGMADPLHTGYQAPAGGMMMHHQMDGMSMPMNHDMGNMNPEAHQQMMQQMQNMSPEAHQQMMQQMQNMSPEAHQKMMQQMQNMSPEEHQKMMQQMQNMSPEEHQKMMQQMHGHDMPKAADDAAPAK